MDPGLVYSNKTQNKKKILHFYMAPRIQNISCSTHEHETFSANEYKVVDISYSLAEKCSFSTMLIQKEFAIDRKLRFSRTNFMLS